ncbi:MAG: DUF4862 family protein [Candidatus Marinimicrobia bacterium]|nr:DUF4862 family protein [Candidatus Neomarinimicrobiota bacterium]
MTGYIVGLYATSPTLMSWDEVIEQKYLDAINDSHLPIRGLELPFWGQGLHPFNEDFLLRNIQSDWENVLTCIPGTMKALSADKAFGLSSTNESSRQAAINFYKRALDAVRRLNSHQAKQSVIAVHISSAPHPEYGSMGMFKESMEELSAWNWEGAKLVIEHCDSGVGSYPYIKGFHPIEAEIEVLLSIVPVRTELGLVINWARSVIEHRSPQGAILHLGKARESGLLRGLIFSGTSDKASEYGAWGDMHMPVAKEEGIDHYHPDSLMTKSNMKASLLAAEYQTLDYLGIKVLSMPIESSKLSDRVGINQDTLAILDRAIVELQQSYHNSK